MEGHRNQQRFFGTRLQSDLLSERVVLGFFSLPEVERVSKELDEPQSSREHAEDSCKGLLGVEHLDHVDKSSGSPIEQMNECFIFIYVSQ